MSDRRLIEIQALDHSIDDGSAVFRRRPRCSSAYRGYYLLAYEKINDVTVPRAYCDAFWIAMKHRDQASARTVAERELLPCMLVNLHVSREGRKLQKLFNDLSR